MLAFSEYHRLSLCANVYDCCTRMETAMGEKAPVPLAEEITRVCKEKGRGVKPGHSDRFLQYVTLLLFLGLE